jgi:hypothetical protein
MVYGLIPRSPRSAGLVSLRRLAGSPPARLDTSVGVSGPHGFAVCACRARLLRQSRPSHPAPTPVTIAIRPSWRCGTGRDIHLICVSEKENYFLREGLTGFRKISPTGKSAANFASAGTCRLVRARLRALTSHHQSASSSSSSSSSSWSPVSPPVCSMPSASKAWPFSTIHSTSE